jgi:hypothetical protein
MLNNVAIALALLWVVGVATNYTLSGFIHILAVLALVLPIIQLIKLRSQRLARANHASRIHLG